jgi:hypothetical protein
MLRVRILFCKIAFSSQVHFRLTVEPETKTSIVCTHQGTYHRSTQEWSSNPVKKMPPQPLVT